MRTENYFKKNGVIYGVSSKFAFGQWDCYIKKFNNLEKAYIWLNEQEYDFRERQLCSKSKVKYFLTFMNCSNKEVLN